MADEHMSRYAPRDSFGEQLVSNATLSDDKLKADLERNRQLMCIGVELERANRLKALELKFSLIMHASGELTDGIAKTLDEQIEKVMRS